jgi:hypothetical protein
MSDLISRSAFLQSLRDKGWLKGDMTDSAEMIAVQSIIDDAPAVDAVVLPVGMPGDYLEWDNGVGHRQIYRIHSIMICEDCMRYELSDFSPVVGHKGIVQILSSEHLETLAKERGKAWKYMWYKERKG